MKQSSQPCSTALRAYSCIITFSIGHARGNREWMHVDPSTGCADLATLTWILFLGVVSFPFSYYIPQ